ncbi:MAG: hypothetical protein LBP41_02365 [Holosporaceae bacterium]|jgi:hypothetical protein|nr:hypothetical protein [Holosporaceae bacterium]
MQFNEKEFLEDVQEKHMREKSESDAYAKISDPEVRRKLADFVKYDGNPMISRALDEICANVVGRTMFKVLMAKMKVQKRKSLKIEKIHDPEEGSFYEDGVVYVNFYESNGAGKNGRYYFYIKKENREIKMKLKSLAGSIFHEFCHALHDISGTHISSEKNVLCIDETLFKDIWDDDEELRAICCVDNDPICDHCFDMVQSIMKSELFRPRYSHGGCIDEPGLAGCCPKSVDLSKFEDCINASEVFMNGWRKYSID